MSTIILAQCWRMQMPPTAKAVLISLADNANDHGYCWPSIETISDRTCIGRTAVMKAIKWLESQKALSVYREGRSNKYQITPDEYTGDAGGNNHYVYKITHRPSGVFYVGLRTAPGSPEKDGYFGSGRACDWLRSVRAECDKEILSRHTSREEAAKAETQKIIEVIGNPLCLNKRVDKLDQEGPAGGLIAKADQSTWDSNRSAKATSVVRQTDPNRKEPSRTTKQEPPAGDASLKTKKPKARQQTFVEWAESMGEADLVPADDPIFEWAEKAGVPADWLELAWLAFDDRYTDSPKRYGDWRAVFRNAVKGDWLKVWGVRDGRAYLTTAGEQWQQFRDRRAA